MLVQFKPKVLKPRGVVVNFGHPLARKLAFATILGSGCDADLVKGFSATYGSVAPTFKTLPAAGVGAALDFSPSSNTASIKYPGTVSDTPYTGDLTVIWSGRVASYGSFCNLASKHLSNGATNCPFNFLIGSSGVISMVRSNATTSDEAETLAAIPSTSTVITVGFTWPGSGTAQPNAKAYLNGLPAGAMGTGANNNAAPYTGSSTPIQIGARPDGLAANQQALYFYIWSRVLTAAEILWLFLEPYAFFAAPSLVQFKPGPPPTSILWAQSVM